MSELPTGWSFVAGNKRRIWTASLQAVTPPVRSCSGFSIYATQFVPKGMPVIAGPNTPCANDLVGWNRLRILNGWHFDLALYDRGAYWYTKSTPLMPIYPCTKAIVDEVNAEKDYSAIHVEGDHWVLDPEYGPDYEWRDGFSNATPPRNWPDWNLINHSNNPTLVLAKQRYRIRTDERPYSDPFHSCETLVFVTARDVHANEEWTFKYDHPALLNEPMMPFY